MILSSDAPWAGLEADGARIVAAGVAGPSHRLSGKPCQDAFAAEIVDGRVAAVVCDGAGSAARAEDGARLCSRVVAEAVAQALRMGWDCSCGDGRAEAILTEAITRIRAHLTEQAQAQGGALADYHATLVGLAAGPAGGLLFHIGDGAAVAAPTAAPADAPWQDAIVSKPENGEYANETYFFTLDGWKSHLRITPLPPVRMAALMSDGTAAFAMLPGDSGPDLRFLGPVQRYLEKHPAAQGAAALAATLDDDRAKSISSDDKTLVLIWLPASEAPAEADAAQPCRP